MKTKKYTAKEGSRVRPGKTGVIVTATVGVLVLLFVGYLLFGPSLTARGVFSDVLKAVASSDGTVILCDPYVEGNGLPTSRQLSLSGDAGKALLEDFLGAFDAYQYVESTAMNRAKLWPYFRVTGEKAVYVYLDEDSVWVEKNATFYRLRPRGSEGEAAYAAFYEMTEAYLTADSAE